MLTVIIPSKTEVYLNNTILDVLDKAKEPIEIMVGLDGYDDVDIIKDPRVNYFSLPASEANQKRHLINEAVRMCNGRYIMALDAHCMLYEGFDVELKRVHQPNWVQIPRRLRLDAKKWQVIKDDRLPIDYEYWKWRDFKDGGLHGYKWDERTKERMEIPVDETLHFQGSCYFMTKEYFYELGLMQIDGFGGFTQEAEEITLKAWLSGGKVMINKNTWYAHLHKGKEYGRMYKLNWEEKKEGDAYSYDLFVNKNRAGFVDLINRFMPLPNWPENWQEYLK